MDLRLLESRRKTEPTRFLGVGVVSLTIHAAVIAGAAYGTLHAVPGDTQVKLDTTAVLLTPPPQRQPPEPMPLAAPLKGFQTVVVPTLLPTTIPPVDLREHFDPKDYSGTGVEGGRADGVTPDANEVYAEALVDEKPSLLSGPPPLYPELLRQAGIQGRVIIQAIVDTTGRVEPSSVRILKSPNPGFDEPSRQWIVKALFRPARLRGQAVRALINLPFDYSVATSGARPRGPGGS